MAGALRRNQNRTAHSEQRTKGPTIRVLFLLVAILYIFSMLAGCSFSSSGVGIVINEVVSSSSRLALDGSIGTPDWIELYNASDKDIDLRGYMLTDGQASAPSPFSNAVLGAGEYIVVYAPGSKASANQGVCCVDFEISKDGEQLYLLSPANEIENQITVPALLTDVSFARRSDNSYGYSTDITPGSKKAMLS